MVASDNPHLSKILTPIAEGNEQDDDSGLPDLQNSANQCHARAAEKPVFSLHIITQEGTARAFQYAHIESDSNFTPDYICIRFSGDERTQIQIYGRNLWRLFGLIHDHRMRWVRPAAKGRDFGQENKDEAFVKEVRIEKVS
jgi:hypothetical protein